MDTTTKWHVKSNINSYEGKMNIQNKLPRDLRCDTTKLSAESR